MGRVKAGEGETLAACCCRPHPSVLERRTPSSIPPFGARSLFSMRWF